MHKAKNEAGRRLARNMSIIAAFLVCAGAYAQSDRVADTGHTAYDTVLKTFVKDGLVDYAGLKKDPQMLDQYVKSLSQVSEGEFNIWDKDRQLAYLINLYNAATLKLIVDHYPVKSIKKIGGFFRGPWDQPVVTFLGKTITLNTLEHKIIRKKYDEPRIHAALVCAAMGCPPLRREPYIGRELDTQLDDQSKVFLTSPKGLRIDRQNQVVYLSSIFKWYGKDFINKYTPTSGFSGFNETERAVLNFCNRYLSDADQAYLAAGEYSVKYMDYDWALNEQPQD